MKISNKTLKLISKKVGNKFSSDFESFSVEKTEVKIETPKPTPEPTPIVESEPVVEMNPTPEVETTLEDDSTATQVITHGQPTE